jgi:hypothetical protein
VPEDHLGHVASIVDRADLDVDRRHDVRRAPQQLELHLGQASGHGNRDRLRPEAGVRIAEGVERRGARLLDRAAGVGRQVAADQQLGTLVRDRGRRGDGRRRGRHDQRQPGDDAGIWIDEFTVSEVPTPETRPLQSRPAGRNCSNAIFVDGASATNGEGTTAQRPG